MHHIFFPPRFNASVVVNDVCVLCIQKMYNIYSNTREKKCWEKGSVL